MISSEGLLMTNKRRTRTLDAFIGRFLKYPSVIECPEMWIETSTLGKKCFEGYGEISMQTNASFEFVLHGKVGEVDNLFERLKRAQERPDDVQSQFRLRARDYTGTDWNGGYVALNFGSSMYGVRRISGWCNSLLAEASGDRVARTSGVEVIYDRPLRLPVPQNMVTSVQRGGDEIYTSYGFGTKTISAVGTSIEIFHDAQHEAVWGVADTSELFCHPFADSWLGLPFRMLLGEQVYPRLAARNYGEGRAAVWVRRAPGRNAESLVASILEVDPFFAEDQFWALYGQLLEIVARYEGPTGRPSQEAPPLVRFYDEIISASSGSHWVLCLSLASAIEGISKLMLSESEMRSSYSDDDLESIKEHVAAWQGNRDLKGRMLNSVEFVRSKGITSSLRFMADEGVISRDHLEAWKTVRNQVMHGSLISPWRDQETDRKMRLLIELLHRVSKVYVRRVISTYNI